MAKEYIEREAAIEAIMSDPPNAHYPSWYIDRIKTLSAADVAPVVRCEDCLYSTERYGHLECIHGVSYRNTWNKPDFFCPYGDRKGGVD